MIRSRQKQSRAKKAVVRNKPALTIGKIRKRDSRYVEFDRSKITNAVHKAFLAINIPDRGNSERVAKLVEEAFVKRFGDKTIPTVEEIQDIVEEMLIQERHTPVAKAYMLYRQKRREIREAKYFILSHNVKTELTPNAMRVLESRYLRKDEHGKIQETPTQLFQRVASNIASAEKIYNPDISDDELFKTEEKFYRLIASLFFLPNSPTLMNAGANIQQLAACFVLPVSDSLTSIFDAVKHTALIHQTGGGTGFSFSRIRPKGDFVKSTSGVASGPISFIRVFDAATDVIKQGGRRRGANMGVLNVHHPDILDFIQAKERDGILLNFNISVAATDKFMDAVKKDADYELINPRSGQVVKKISARGVWDLITELAWKTGDPGVIFIDRMNNPRGNPTPQLGRIESTNPCGEQPLLPYESCNLGSINVSRLLARRGKKLALDWKLLKEVTHDAVHFLDNVIDMNRYPLPEIEELTKGNRRIGLGVMGFADALARMEMSYDSAPAIRFAEKLMEFINREARAASVNIAKKRGVFPNFKGSVYDRHGGEKLRNCALTTIAPTGTISIIAGCSSAIEPFFAVSYLRKNVLGGQELLEINSVFEEIAREEGWWSREVMKEVAESGSVAAVKGVPAKWRRIFVTAHEISPEWHVKTQAAFQKHTDNAVSKTINFSHDAPLSKVREAYVLAWSMGCKGITIYRDQSKAQQVLHIMKNGKNK